MSTIGRFAPWAARPSTSDSSTLHEHTSAQRPDDRVTPYLGLNSRLSQVWINRWTVLLFLVLARTLIGVADLNDGIQNAHREAMSACNSVESIGSALASSPHYMAAGVNTLTADGIEKSIHALMSMLLLTVTGVEELVLFVIHLLTSTYLCLITFAVGGSLHVAIDLLEDVSGFLNTTLHSIGQDIENGATDFQDSLNKAISNLNDLSSTFGSSHNIPTLDLTSQIDELNNLQLPTNFNSDLEKLNASIPSFAQVQNFTDNVIRLPFEEVKKLINESLPAYSFNHTLFPVPAKKQLTFCSDNDKVTDFFQHLIDIEITARKVAIAVLILLAIAVCVPMAWREVRRYRFQQDRAAIIGTNQYEPMDVVYITSRPYSSSTGLWVAKYFKSTRVKTLVRWVIAYATTPPALVVLALGLAGLFSCLCQWLILRLVAREVPELAEEVGEFAEHVVRSLENASMEWANGTNQVILRTNDKINEDVFGWVNTSTTAMNNTLNVFSDEMIKALNFTFGGTVLYEPVLEVYNCLIGLKVAGIEKGLTWVQDHAHVTFPLLPNDTFSKGANESLANDGKTSSLLADPQNDVTSAVTAALEKLVDKLETGIRNEAIISSCVVMLYVTVLLMGIARAAWLIFRKEKYPDTYITEKPTPYGGPAPSTSNFFYSNNAKGPSTQFEDIPLNSPAAPRSTNPFADPHVAPTSDGNLYKGVQYTLQPTPMTVPANAAADQSDAAAQIGYAGQRGVSGATRPASDRRSHHPEIASGRSPV